jgi:hypothetical protein
MIEGTDRVEDTRASFRPANLGLQCSPRMGPASTGLFICPTFVGNDGLLVKGVLPEDGGGVPGTSRTGHNFWNAKAHWPHVPVLVLPRRSSGASS